MTSPLPILRRMDLDQTPTIIARRGAAAWKAAEPIYRNYGPRSPQWLAHLATVFGLRYCVGCDRPMITNGTRVYYCSDACAAKACSRRYEQAHAMPCRECGARCGVRHGRCRDCYRRHASERALREMLPGVTDA